MFTLKWSVYSTTDFWFSSMGPLCSRLVSSQAVVKYDSQVEDTSNATSAHRRCITHQLPSLIGVRDVTDPYRHCHSSLTPLANTSVLVTSAHSNTWRQNNVLCATFHQPLCQLETKSSQTTHDDVTLMWMARGFCDCRQRQWSGLVVVSYLKHVDITKKRCTMLWSRYAPSIFCHFVGN